MGDLLRLVGGTTKAGVRSGELVPGADPRETASVVVGTSEGALMLAKLCDDPEHMRRAVGHVERYLRTLERRRGGTGEQTANRGDGSTR
jgi:TetR/AcrR family transcriptional repressor of nem operon